MDKDFIELIEMHNASSIRTDRRCISGYKLHWHTFYEVEIAVRGKGKNIINGTPYDERMGNVSVMRLNDFHELRLEEECEIFHVQIPVFYIPDEIVNMLTIIEGGILTNIEGEKLEIIKNLFYALEKFSEENDYFHERIKKHIACSMILFILDNIDSDMKERCSLSNVRLREMISYIQANFALENLVDEIAANFYIGKQYLLQFFKKHTGITLVSYIRKIRLNYAARLLITTNKKISDISEESGFNSLSTFMRNFKSEYGVLPVDMRNNYVKNISEK
ncbi:MAG: helix-turn-helix domain-containing protein [Ruminococcaceae bacterium]|nr:helix-turn-helix domain-containing protein [Oscillospiraceae bacterium]